MLESVKDEFDRRSDEIDILYSHVQKVDIEAGEQSNETASQLRSILASSFCLILYNQVESTAFSCVEAIYDGIHERRVNFNQLVRSFKKKILQDCKGEYHSPDSLLDALRDGDIAEALARASLKLEKIFSGNVDAKKIKMVMGYYNLTVTNPNHLNNGAELQQLKTARNSLAHGSSSFEKYGRDLTITDLDKLRNNVREYMSHVINLTQAYLDAQLYLAPSDAA